MEFPSIFTGCSILGITPKSGPAAEEAVHPRDDTIQPWDESVALCKGVLECVKKICKGYDDP